MIDKYDTPRWLDPEEQIAALMATVAHLQELPPDAERIQALRQAEARLANLVAKHERGELEPLWDDGFDSQ